MPSKVAAKWVERIENATAATKLKATELEVAETEAEHAALTEWLLTHPKAKLAAVIATARKTRPSERPTLEHCIDLAKNLDLTMPLPEAVKAYAKKKVGKAGHRIISEFGLQHRTAQQMVKSVLEVGFEPRPFQFDCNGSVAGAIKQIRKQVAEGKHHFAHMDIESFFTNFDPEKLSMNLPLPKWAVEHVVSGRQMKWNPSGRTHSALSIPSLIQGARRGIPQGSSVSSLVAAIECSKLDLSVSALCNYVDDFLILAHALGERQVAMAELRGAVEALPGGHSILKTKSAGHLSEGCVLLGHEIRLVGDKLVVKPSTANYERLCAKLREIEKGQRLYASVPKKKVRS